MCTFFLPLVVSKEKPSEAGSISRICASFMARFWAEVKLAVLPRVSGHEELE